MTRAQALAALCASVMATALPCACHATPVEAAPPTHPRTATRAPAVAPRAIRLSPLDGGIGFDDLGFSPKLHKVLVPAGALGRIDLVDPDSLAVTSTLRGTSKAYAGGHGEGITSADTDGTRLFATDRTSRRVLVVNSATGELLSSAPLGGHPDYVRWVDGTHELWVAEPREERIEVLSLGSDNALRPAGQIRVEGGPESLVIDERGKRAFTHLWDGVTLAIDVGKRSILAKWPNGCRGSRGIAFDESDGIPRIAAEPFMRVVGEMLDLEEEVTKDDVIEATLAPSATASAEPAVEPAGPPTSKTDGDTH